MEQVSTAEQHLHRHVQSKASDAVKNISTGVQSSGARDQQRLCLGWMSVHLVTVRITAGVMKSDHSGAVFQELRTCEALQQTETFWTLSCNFVPTRLHTKSLKTQTRVVWKNLTEVLTLTREKTSGIVRAETASLVSNMRV